MPRETMQGGCNPGQGHRWQESPILKRARGDACNVSRISGASWQQQQSIDIRPGDDKVLQVPRYYQNRNPCRDRSKSSSHAHGLMTNEN